MLSVAVHLLSVFVFSVPVFSVPVVWIVGIVWWVRWRGGSWYCSWRGCRLVVGWRVVGFLWTMWVVRAMRDHGSLVGWCMKLTCGSWEGAPLHSDRFLNHFWAVQLGVAKLLRHCLANFPLDQVGYETSHNLAVSGGLQVTVFFRLHHGRVNVLVKAFLWPCKYQCLIGETKSSSGNLPSTIAQ